MAIRLSVLRAGRALLPRLIIYLIPGSVNYIYNSNGTNLNGALHKSFPSVCATVVKERLSRNATTATNERAKTEELLGVSFPVRSVSYRRKADN
jgi:hypothetical protein